MKKKKLLICLLLVVIFNALICCRVKATDTIADSGFGSSYSGGGSSHSSSHSSSYSSSHSSSGSSGSSKSWSEMTPLERTVNVIVGVFSMTFVGGFYIAIIIIVLKNRSKTLVVTEQQKIETENKIKQYIPDFDKDKFLADGYQIYLDVQDAWMNFKLEDVKDKITDEMFNMYESQLATLEVKGQQNVMKDFHLRSSYLKGVNVQNDNIAINAVFVVDFYDYIIEQATGKVVRGTDKSKLLITYEMEFRKTLNKENVKIKCPNCGAELDKLNGFGECEFCRTKIVTENQEWVLTNKKTVSQINL